MILVQILLRMIGAAMVTIVAFYLIGIMWLFVKIVARAIAVACMGRVPVWMRKFLHVIDRLLKVTI